MASDSAIVELTRESKALKKWISELSPLDKMNFEALATLPNAEKFCLNMPEDHPWKQKLMLALSLRIISSRLS
jgi:hypothetical protein